MQWTMESFLSQNSDSVWPRLAIDCSRHQSDTRAKDSNISSPFISLSLLDVNQPVLFRRGGTCTRVIENASLKDQRSSLLFTHNMNCIHYHGHLSINVLRIHEALHIKSLKYNLNMKDVLLPTDMLFD
jgi:hypothetical protein